MQGINLTSDKAFLMLASILMTTIAYGSGAIHIGSRLELFVDYYLIDQLKGDAELRLHHPIPQQIVFRTDAPWEGNASAYQSIFQDGSVYRMYYRGLHYTHSGGDALALEPHPPFLCYAESTDGIHWRRPNLGIVEFKGSTRNNIILSPDHVAEIGGDPAHTAVFKDANPDCPPDERYKMIIVGSKPRGLYVLKSADGVHFSLMSDKPIQTHGAFDSQNVAFWDPVRKEYREYHRGFRKGVRDILTATSSTILHFPKPQWLNYPDAPVEHLYTNAILPYYRAPHIFIGFPMRYTDRGWRPVLFDLPGLRERLARAKASRRYGTAITDALFMTSRDGITFHRWQEAFIRPGPRLRESWVYGDNFVFWGMVETRSELSDAPNEISLYATEGYWEGTYTSVRRYTLRIDGFVSVHATMRGGEVITKPLVFQGGSLAINVSTSGAGSVRVEIQDAQGKPIEGYSLNDCPEIFCDDIRYIVRWRNTGSDVRPLAGKPIRLRFVLRDADLYSFQFVSYVPEPKRPKM